MKFVYGNYSKRIYRSDLLGAVASGLCAIHCTLTPIFFVAKPVLDGALVDHADCSGIWAVLDYVFLVLSLAAVWYSARHTNLAIIKWILWIAWVVFAVGLLSEPLDLSHGKWLMYAGSITLVITHLQNYRYCQKCKDEMCQ